MYNPFWLTMAIICFIVGWVMPWYAGWVLFLAGLYYYNLAKENL